MPDPVQHATLIIGMLDLLHLHHLSLFQYFHRIEAMIVLGLHQMHSSETPSTEGALQGEVVLRVLSRGGALLLGGLRLGWLVAMLLGTVLGTVLGAVLGVLVRILGDRLGGIGRGVHDVVDAGGVIRAMVRRSLRRGGLHGGAFTVRGGGRDVGS